MRELVDLSREVAQSRDFERFVLRFAERILIAENADCVDVYRARGGVIRSVVAARGRGSDPSLRDTVLDTARYPSLEPTLRDHAPVALNDLDDERLGDGEAELMRGWGIASSVTMPLVAGGKLVGLLILYDDAERDWNAELEFLTSVCQLVAGVFDSTALLEEAEDRARYRGVLIELGAALAPRKRRWTSPSAPRRACEAPWSAPIATSGGSRRDISAVWPASTGTAWTRACAAGSSRLDHYPSTRQALEDREILVISSLYDERLTDEEREDFGEFDFHSLVSIPLVSNDLVVGLIDIFDVRERDYDDVRSFLPSAGRTVADALRNAELLAGLRRGNAAQRELVELGDRLNEADTLEGLSRVVAERLRTILSAEDCDIWQVDGDVLRCLASVDSRGWDEEEAGSERDLAEYEATVDALAANEPIVVGDLDSSELGDKEAEAYRRWGFRSMVSLPLVVDGRAIGLIDVFDTRVRDYGGHLDFIRSVGRLLAGSFEKAMLVERLEGGNRDLRLLVESGMDFGATLEVDAVLRTVAERILDVSQADLCDVYRLDGEEVEILLSIGQEWDEDPAGRRFPLADYSTFLSALEERRPVATRDILTGSSLTKKERDEAEEWGYRSTIDVPLISHGDVIGFISLMNREVRGFSREEVVVGLAQVASQAIANAALYRELDDNLGRMALVSESALELASSLDLQETLLATARRLCDGMGVRICEITVIEGDELHTLMQVSDGEVDEAWIGQRLSLADAAVIREVIETKRPAAVESLRDPRLTPAVLSIARACGHKSWATLPLIVKDRVIGAVELIESRAERTFTEAELATAGAICHAAALAIDNAALFARAQQTTRETQLLNDIATRTAASLDLEEVVTAAVDELGQLMTFDDHSVLLLEGDVIGCRDLVAPPGRCTAGRPAQTTSARASSSVSTARRSSACAFPRTRRRWPAPRRSKGSARRSWSRCPPTPACSACSTSAAPTPAPSRTSTVTCSSGSARSSRWRSRTRSSTKRSSGCTSATSRR